MSVKSFKNETEAKPENGNLL